MSELVTPRNFSDGLVVDTSLTFHAAWAASHWPAFRPTRGSGFGATAEAPLVVEVDLPQPASARTPERRVRGIRAAALRGAVRLTRRAGAIAESCERAETAGRCKGEQC